PGLSTAASTRVAHLRRRGPRGLVWPSRHRAAAARWIDRLDIRCTDPRQSIAELSGGNQQKVAVARLLHHGVDALILDEPTKGIDVGSKAQMYQLIDEMVGAGKGVLLGSSYVP